MTIEFCPGYNQEPFRNLVRDYPGDSVYPRDDFRVEWGPMFHRGRLDGTARLLVIGQDPAQHETVVRRILVGAAGKRVQGFVAKVGLTRGYVLVNTFLYSVYGQGNGSSHITDPTISVYRNAWLKAILDQGGIQAVVSLGTLADKSWKQWLKSPDAAGRPLLTYKTVPHPTSPEGAGGSPAKQAAATAAMLVKYNSAITSLRQIVTGEAPLPPLYGADFLPEEYVDIPMADLPAGTPDWMATERRWAERTGDTPRTKRRTITVTVPDALIPNP